MRKQSNLPGAKTGGIGNLDNTCEHAGQRKLARKETSLIGLDPVSPPGAGFFLFRVYVFHPENINHALSGTGPYKAPAKVITG
ncbi:MAG: hypothetical protein ACRERR_13205 [Moraxellaceae bacterium]